MVEYFPSIHKTLGSILALFFSLSYFNSFLIFFFKAVSPDAVQTGLKHIS